MSNAFKHTDDNIFKNTEDNYWTMASDMESRIRIREGKEVETTRKDRVQSKAYFRKPYIPGPWSGLKRRD